MPLIFLIIVISSAVCVPIANAAERYAFFFALKEDISAFQKLLASEGMRQVKESRGVGVFLADDKEFYTILMGSGPVSTALSAQEILVTSRIDAAFSVGVVGGLSDELKINQWVFVDTVIPWQKGFAPENRARRSTAEALSWQKVPENRMKIDDGELVGVSVASGETFINHDIDRKALHDLTDADVVDMNLFGLLAALNRRQVPSWHLRVITDYADSNASADFQSFIDAYSGEGGRRLAEIVMNLEADLTNPGSYRGLEALLGDETETPEAFVGDQMEREP